MLIAVIVVIVGLLIVAAVVRLIWSASHGDAEIESSSYGHQVSDDEE